MKTPALACALLSVALLTTGCTSSPPPGYIHASGVADTDARIVFHGLWKVDAAGEEPVAIVLNPEQELTVMMLDREGGTPEADKICLFPEGLFVAGERIETSATTRLFLVQDAQTLIPIPLPLEDARSLTPTKLEQLGASALWHAHIQPLLAEH